MPPQYQHDQWQAYAWRKAERTYSVSLQQNLFGQWVVIRDWGVTDSRRGGHMEHLLPTYDAGLEQLAQIRKRRSAKGYALQ